MAVSHFQRGKRCLASGFRMRLRSEAAQCPLPPSLHWVSTVAVLKAKLRFKNVDDHGRDEEETPDNTTADDEDDHTNEEKIR